MKQKVLIVDTCLACVWMRVPEMEFAGPDNDKWDFDRVNKKIQEEVANGTLLVLPMASIIETGNHITQIKGRDRMPYIQQFGDMITKAVDGQIPWALYNQQNHLWESEHIKTVVEHWISMNKEGKHSFGDVSILDVATAYRSWDKEVEILTADRLLKSFENIDLNELDVPAPPRRKSRK